MALAEQIPKPAAARPARTWSTHLAGHAGETVRLEGWLHRLRRLRNVGFLVLRDQKGLAQIVLDDPRQIEQVAALPEESVLAVTGEVVAVAAAPGGAELHHPRVVVLSAASAPPPFDLYRPTIAAQLPARLDHAAVALRHPRQRALFHIAAASMAGFRQVLRRMEFVEIQTPKIVGSATEGGANVFTVDYFGRPAYLSQSPQLYKQMMVGVFERVYEIGPAFRAEPHDTPRHLNEFVSLDAELGFIRDHRDVMDVLTQALRGMLAAIRDEAGAALDLLRLDLPAVPDPVPTIHFEDALALLDGAAGDGAAERDGRAGAGRTDAARQEQDGQGQDGWEPSPDTAEGRTDLSPADERWLGEWARRVHGSDFLFVTGYPAATKPFYTAPDPERPGATNSFDLLFRGVELVSGGQRLHRYEDYLAALEARGMDPSGFAGYLEAFRYGMPPHGGFAIGLERWVARLAGVANVRETTLFPRDLHRLAP